LLIDRNQNDVSQYQNLNAPDSDLFREVLDHAYFCNETVEKFRGRVDILNKIRYYILARSNHSPLAGSNDSPLVLYGGSGCGKTAIVAKVTSQVIIFFF
jgi:hypothetical protein